MNLLSIALLVVMAAPIAERYEGPVAEPYDGLVALAYSGEVKIVAEKIIEPAHPHGPFARVDERLSNGRIKRLPGPTWWACPGCSGSSCTMYLGQHLRGTHRQSTAQLNRIGHRDWYTYHDNLHNLAAAMAKMTKPAPKPKAKATPTIKEEATCSGCQGGRCGLFGRWRRW